MMPVREPAEKSLACRPAAVSRQREGKGGGGHVARTLPSASSTSATRRNTSGSIPRNAVTTGPPSPSEREPRAGTRARTFRRILPVHELVQRVDLADHGPVDGLGGAREARARWLPGSSLDARIDTAWRPSPRTTAITPYIFASSPHIPTRQCLGCTRRVRGGALRRHGYAQRTVLHHVLHDLSPLVQIEAPCFAAWA